MTISYEAHRAADFVLGVIVGGVPLAMAASSTISISSAATVFCGFAGALLTLQGIAGTKDGDPLPPNAHALADRALAALLIAAAILLGVADQAFASLLCASAGIVLAALVAFTRFSTQPSDQDPSNTATPT